MKLSVPIYRLKRRARLLARGENIPLHAALDRVARDEGHATWSLLASRAEPSLSPATILSRLSEGDLLLLGARPAQGKTMLGLRILLDAAREGRKAVFFTLEYSEAEARRRIRSLDEHQAGKVEIVTSEDIAAAFIVNYLSGAPRGTVAVIDYLQLLDQQRSKPALPEQIEMLRSFARTSGTILCFLSQIDRGFDPDTDPVPEIRHVRLPNPVEPSFFSKACFLHGGGVGFRELP